MAARSRIRWAVVPTVGLLAATFTGCGEDIPYTKMEMYEAQLHCENSAYGAGDALAGRERDPDAEMECLRDELPELSDDQLNRLDHLIEEQSN